MAECGESNARKQSDVCPGGKSPDSVLAHEFSSGHKAALERDRVCGCFYCLKIFSPSEIDTWLFGDNPCDRDGTAVCPYCGVDAVIGESSGFPVTEEFLGEMRRVWF